MRPTTAKSDTDGDLTLITEVAKGDGDAFETLVTRYERRVLNLAYRYLGNRTDAEDAAQEIFLKVWRNAKRFRKKSSFSTWLFRIAVNHCLNAKSRRKRRETLPLNEAVLKEGPDTEEEYERERTARAVREAVGALPTRQRMALVLSKFEGRSYKEIAEVIGVSVPSVESLIFRAKQNLKRALGPYSAME